LWQMQSWKEQNRIS